MLERLVHRWFVRYNPFYFFSALCILTGVFLVSTELAADDVLSHVLLVSVVQLYEGLLILAAAVLLRKTRSRRPAVILGLVELFFLVDVALGHERIAGLGGATFGLAVGLGLLGLLKLWLLLKALRLGNEFRAFVTLGPLLLLLPIAPHLIEAGGVLDSSRQGLHLTLFWFGSLFLATGLVQHGLRVHGWNRTMMHRVAMALPLIASGLWIVHGIAWSVYLSLPLSFAHAAPYLLVGGTAASVSLAGRGCRLAAEVSAVLSIGGSVALAGFPSPMVEPWFELPFAVGRPVALFAFVGAAIAFALTRTASLRLALPGILSGLGGLYLLGGRLSEPPAVLVLALAIVLLAAAARNGSFVMLAGSGLVLGLEVLLLIPIGTDAVPLAVVVAGTWIGGWTWMLFPRLRWVTLSVTTGFVALGGILLFDPDRFGDMLPWYGGLTTFALGMGAALKRPFYVASGSAGAVLSLFHGRGIWLPESTLAWGVLVLVTGFSCLAGGFVLNLHLSRAR